MEIKKIETGTINMTKVKESISSIEFLTNRYKRKRISTESYIRLVHENLASMTTQRDYLQYLKNIGQN